MEILLDVPIDREELLTLCVGDSILISGTIYTARDAAHKRMIENLDAGINLPINIENAFIYYMGPSPAPDGKAIGSAGPTTSARMDAYTPQLLGMGLAGMIGKGDRDDGVVASIIENKAIYLACIGGAGALLSRSIIRSKVVAYEDLGTEAIRELRIKDFPAIVAIDVHGNNIYRR